MQIKHDTFCYLPGRSTTLNLKFSNNMWDLCNTESVPLLPILWTLHCTAKSTYLGVALLLICSQSCEYWSLWSTTFLCTSRMALKISMAKQIFVYCTFWQDLTENRVGQINQGISKYTFRIDGQWYQRNTRTSKRFELFHFFTSRLLISRINGK